MRKWMGFVVVAAMAAAAVLVGSPAQATIYDKRNDFNRDGVSDIPFILSSGGMMVQVGDGSGGVDRWADVGFGWFPYRYDLSAPGDLNRDGVGDLVSIHYDNGCLYRWYGDGDGTVSGGTQLGCGWGPYSLAGAGDLNNDGNGDLVAVNGNNDCLYRWYGNGNGGFGTGVQLGCSGWSLYAGALTGAGDLNGDGNADLVGINNGNNCLYRFNGNGSGGFSSGVQVGCGWGNFIDIAGLGDFNRDGKGDLVALHSNGDLYRYHGNGSGGYASPSVISVGMEWYFLAS
ncbi:FG-GAP repeat domain-containing protein [Micromonospora sp. L31]|uniref:FG-GAP repeat domain-containing protein n=1 Tax=Micromonospora sp. L31 TaxID=3452213 RepID=UPI003F8CA2AB